MKVISTGSQRKKLIGVAYSMNEVTILHFNDTNLLPKVFFEQIILVANTAI